MNARLLARRSLPWAIAAIGGFLAAYLVVATFVFPSGIVPRDVRVPNVVGLTFDDAVRLLAEQGLRGVRGEERHHAASPKGTVLDQAPGSGKRDVDGAAVTLVVSAGQEMKRVPAVTGMLRDAAQLVLEEAGFELGEVVERADRAARATVLESQPAAGADAPASSAVRLVVSAGPPARGGGR